MGRSWLKLCGASLCVLGTALSLPLSAFQIKSDNTELSGYLDTTVTAGAGIRTSDRSKSNVGLFSGGTNPSTNGDNGNLNYDQWDFYSAALKTLHELELHYRRLTLFSRLSALYDTDVMDGSTRRTPLGNDAEHLQGRGIKLLDAYLSWDGELKGVEFTLRSGNQVLSWGESTFIQNGLNVINPVDVSKLRVAGAELKEALLPVPMIGLEVDLTQKFSLGAFYQVRWEETKIDPLGTFFSTNDAISPDAQFLMTDATVDDTVSCTSLSCPGGGSIGQSVRRGTDIDGSDSGNYGIVLRYFEPKLNDTEFGLYAMKYSSRLPVMSGFKGAKTMPGVLLAATYFPESYYFVEYPDDICMYGFSFNTTVESIAVQGEYSLKHDHPVQIDTSLLVPAIVGMTTLGAIPDETLIHGFRRKDISQAQLTLTWNAGRCLAAGCVVVVGEVGATYVHGLESLDDMKYKATGSEWGHFATSFSWGYRLMAMADYHNAFCSWSFSPSIAFSHDVNGRTPAPLGNFLDGRKAVTTGVTARYQNYAIACDYTTFFGAGVNNDMRDRDFATISASVSF